MFPKINKRFEKRIPEALKIFGEKQVEIDWENRKLVDKNGQVLAPLDETVHALIVPRSRHLKTLHPVFKTLQTPTPNRKRAASPSRAESSPFETPRASLSGSSKRRRFEEPAYDFRSLKFS
jgi:hypothetical protein